MTSPALSLSNLFFAYEERPILENVNLVIEPGEFIGIVGPNGGGKTTFLKILMGFLTPTHGSVLLFGMQPAASRKAIGYVPQSLRVDRDFPITVREQILLGALSNSPFYSPHARRRCKELMEKLHLSAYADHPFSSLSGGLAQRALLARALLSDPKLLFLDESLANVDAISSRIILEWLEELKGEKTILLVTHDLNTVLERVERILCVDKQVISLQPRQVCEHFALGLYHTPLLDQPPNHLKQGDHVPHCVFPG